MRRLFRTSTSSVVSWAPHLAAAGSAVLFVGACLLWGRTVRVCDDLGIEWRGQRQAGSVEVYTVRGRIGLCLARGIDLRPDWGGEPFAPPGWALYSNPSDHPPYYPHGRTDHGPFAFVYDGGDDTPGQRFQDILRVVEVPAWSVALSALTLPALWLRSRRARRWPPGSCRRCGYDLRATPDRCPECGSVPKRA